MIGCHRNSDDSTFRHFSRSGTAFDELSIWTRKLAVNRTHNEILYFTAGYGKFCLMSGSCHLDRASNDEFSVECLF